MGADAETSAQKGIWKIKGKRQYNQTQQTNVCGQQKGGCTEQEYEKSKECQNLRLFLELQGGFEQSGAESEQAEEKNKPQNT